MTEIKENDFVLSDTHFSHYNASFHASRMPWIYDNPNYNPSKQFHFKHNNPYAVHLNSHNEDILSNCNKMIPKKGSRLIILGDFAWKDHKNFVQKLNGEKKIMVMGNHDKASQDFFDIFREVPKEEEMSEIRKECISILKRFRNGDIDINDCADGVLSSAWSKFVSLQDWEMADQMSKECLNLFDNVHELGFRTKIKGQDVTFSHYKMSCWASSCHSSISLYGHSHGRMPEFDNVLSCDIGVDVWGYGPVPWCAIMKKMQLKREWMGKNGKYPVDGENKADGQYSKDPEERMIETRMKNKEIMKSLGYEINERMWPTKLLKWPI